MAKIIFRSNEVHKTDEKVMLALTREFEPPKVEVEEEEPLVFEGPDIDALKREAEAFKKEFEKEKQEMFSDAQRQADMIIKDAEAAAFNEVKRKTDESQIIVQKAQDEATRIIEDAGKKAESIIKKAEHSQAAVSKESYSKGFSQGHEDGFKEGEAEVKRLIERMHTIIERTMDRREEILSETEQQIVDLVLLMSRKVVKIISENQRNVVVSNIIHALRKVKGRGDVIVRVNIADVGMTSEHTKDFLSTAENIKNLTILEDSTVDSGGCIVETDFGTVDARIMSQLHELEQKILEISPIKNRVKTANVSK